MMKGDGTVEMKGKVKADENACVDWRNHGYRCGAMRVRFDRG